MQSSFLCCCVPATAIVSARTNDLVQPGRVLAVYHRQVGLGISIINTSLFCQNSVSSYLRYPQPVCGLLCSQGSVLDVTDDANVTMIKSMTRFGVAVRGGESCLPSVAFPSVVKACWGCCPACQSAISPHAAQIRRHVDRFFPPQAVKLCTARSPSSFHALFTSFPYRLFCSD